MSLSRDIILRNYLVNGYRKGLRYRLVIEAKGAFYDGLATRDPTKYLKKS